MTDSDNLAWMGTAELARGIAKREISPIDALDAAIARIEARNPSLGAIVYSDFDASRAAAQAAEKAVMAGDALGPLHGVPVVIKDLFENKAGWKTTFGGIRAFKDYIADDTSPIVAQFERAGAIVVGKGNSPIMGFRGTCDNYLFGPTSTPFDLSRNSGGSSGGSAAAVADGMVSLAQGSDGGGSIRIPASCCGVFGYKAAFGRVPCPIRPEAFVSPTTPFIFAGPITRSVADAALAMEVLGQYEPRDPFSLDQKVDYLAALERPMKGMKVAYSADFDIFPVDPRVAQVVDQAVRAFEEAGAHVEEVKLGIQQNQAELAEMWCRLIVPPNLLALEALKKTTGVDLVKDHPEDLPPEYLSWVDGSFNPTVMEAMADQIVRTQVYDAVQSVFETHDLLVAPTLACLPPVNTDDGNTKGPDQINGEAVNPLLGWCMTYPINFTGHPAASIPAGLAEGLPVGMQIIGRRYGDEDVFAASATFERLRPWQESYQRCEARSL
ncbi:MAG: amidase [Pseudomonadota bacterium]